jgi:hypothetical protein
MGALMMELQERGDPTVLTSARFNKKLESFKGTGRPIEGLLKTLTEFSNASRGTDLGSLAAHDRRLEAAWRTIDDAKRSENEADQKMAEALEGAIIKTLPYIHRLESSKSR